MQLKITFIGLIVSSSVLLVFFLLMAIFSQYPLAYTLGYYVFGARFTFTYVFYNAAIMIQYPLIIVQVFVLLNIARKIPPENRTKLYVGCLLLVSLVGVKILIYMVMGAFFFSVSDEAQRVLLNLEHFFVFFTDYLVIATTMIMLGLTINGFEKNNGHSGKKIITPFIQGAVLFIWVIFDIVSVPTDFTREQPGNYTFRILLGILSCLYAVSLIATNIELLVKLGNINIPQIITTKEKTA